MMLQGRTVFHKLWYFLQTYILTLKRFDLFLQGTLLIVILLESNVYLLLRRDADQGYSTPLIESWVQIAAGVIECVLGAVLAWWGSGRRQFALTGWLGASATAGLLVLAFPFAYSNPANVELCGGEPAFRSLSPRDENVTPRTGILVLTALLCALTKVSIWAHGLTYLDDHDPTNGPYFYGILISIRLSLGLSGTNWFRPSSVRDDWWEGQLSASMLTMMFAILFTFFPTKMPQWQEEEVTVDTDFLPSLYRVINNRIVVIQSVALSLLTTAIFCYVEYDHAYVQARFHVEALRQDLRTSRFLSDFFRSLVVIFFIMIFRVRFSARRPDGVKANTAARVGGVVAVFVAIFFVVLASLGCDTGTLTGLDEEYVQPECSQQCGCNSARYGFSPVCGLDTLATYFSPCHAGCRAVEDLNGFSLYADCACGAQRAALGACALRACSVPFSIYQIFYTIILAVSGASFLMQGMVLVRAVRRVDKPIAIGFSFALVALLSFVVGRLLYMLISYLTCAYSSGGVCVLHRPTLWAMCATSSAMALGSAVVSLIASKTPLEPTTEL